MSDDAQRTNSGPELMERLRARRDPSVEVMYDDPDGELIGEAADEIERLRAALGRIGLTWAEYTNGDWTAEEAMKKVAESYAKASFS